jgi:hypothetical protein
MLKGKCESRRINFGCAIAFIIILSVSATLTGPIAEFSFAQKTAYSTSSFLAPSTKIDSTNVAFISHSHKHSHSVTHFTPRFTPHSPSSFSLLLTTTILSLLAITSLLLSQH